MIVTHKMVFLSIAAIGRFNEASLYPPDPGLVGQNFSFERGFH